jgi:hypothetical protein
MMFSNSTKFVPKEKDLLISITGAIGCCITLKAAASGEHHTKPGANFCLSSLAKLYVNVRAHRYSSPFTAFYNFLF